VVVVVFDVFSVADTVSKADGGTFDGAVTFGGGVSGVLDADDGITVDNITIDGTEIDLSSGDLTIDSAGDIILDAADSITTPTAGTANVKLGNNAGNSIASGGIRNVTVGDEAGTAITTGTRNIAIGYQALATEDTGSRSIAIGHQALTTQNGGTADLYNIGVGHNAGGAITTGIYNTLIGGLAGDSFDDADYNIAVGGLALTSDTKGSNSVAVGYRALTTQNNSSATQANNTAIGTNAGASVTDGINNVFVGHGAGAGHQSGDHSIYIGRDAGYHATPTTTGSYNIFIGSFTDGDANDTGAMIVMGYNVTSVGNQNFTFGNNTTDSNIAFGATSISAPSDERLKEDIKDETVGLAFINELRPVTFQWKKANDIPTDMKAYDKDSDERVMNGKYNHGFIAQEVKAVIDKYDIKNGCGLWAESGKDKRQRLAEGELIPFLVKAIQELSAKNTALEARVTALENAE